MQPGTRLNTPQRGRVGKVGRAALAVLAFCASLGMRAYRGKITRVLLGAIASVGLGWLALHELDWGQVFQTFREFPIAFAFLGILVFFIALLLRAYRWRVLFVHERVSLFRLFMVQNAGIGLNNLMPIRAFSEAAQFLLLTRRDGVTAPTALATLVVVNVLDIFASAILMGVGVIFLPQLRGASIQLAGAIILSIVSLLIVLFVFRKLDTFSLGKRVPFLTRFAAALSALQDRRRRVLASFVLTVGHWLIVGLSGWILAHGLGMDVSLGLMIVLFVAVIFFVSATPSLPGAVGTFEAAVMYTLVTLFSVDKALAFPFAVVMHVVMFVPPTIIALIVLPREGVGLFAKRAAQEPAVVEAGRDPSVSDH